VFSFDSLKMVELEITNRCQAECPMCPRNIHGGIENPLMHINDWTLEDFKSIFSTASIRQIENFTFCGNFGDPVINRHLIDMCEYITRINSATHISIHTNGSLQSTSWWAKIAKVLPESHVIYFALDGLEDTQGLYRVKTDYNKIIENATSFIQNGGRAIWQFLRFKHNQHQVELAEKEANRLGFLKFVVKNTRRFTESRFKVVDRKGKTTHYLEPPENSTVSVVSNEWIESTFPIWSKTKNIYCGALNKSSIFIDANFLLIPCCIIASWLYTPYDIDLFKKYNLYNQDTAVNKIGNKVRNQVLDIINEFGGEDMLNVKKRSIKDIISSNAWQTIWHEKWDNGGSWTCGLMCSKDSPFILLDEQTVKNV